MKTIVCKFINPYDDLDYKKRNNISISKSDATFNDGEKNMYYSRMRIIDTIKAAYNNKRLVSGKKVATEDKIEYTYVINIGEYNGKQIKGKIVIIIPSNLLFADSAIYGQIKVLDMYEARAIKVRKQKRLVAALIAGVTLAGTFGFGYSVINGINKEEQARIKKDKEYQDEYDKYQRYQKFIEEEQTSKECTVAPATYYDTENYITNNTKEKVKTLKMK